MVLLSVSASNFFDVIVDFFHSIWEFLVNAVNALIQLLQVVSAIGNITTIFSPILWGPLMLSMTLVLSIGLIRLLLSMGNE